MTGDNDRHTVRPMPIARRPGRKTYTPTEAIEQMTAAGEVFRTTKAAHDAAIHARARAVHEARHRAGMTWIAIAQAADLSETAVKSLARRYASATRKGIKLHTHHGGRP